MTPDAYLDALLSLPGLAMPLVSPDGRWVAWSWYRTGPAAEVYAAPTDGSTPPVRLTDTPENTHPVSWLPDSSGLLVEQDHNGDEREQLFRVNLDTPLQLQPLTRPTPPYFLRRGQLHPNGQWLVYGANWDHETDQEIEPTWVYCQDLQSGEFRVLAKPVVGCPIAPRLSPDGQRVLHTRQDRRPGGWQIWLADIEGNEAREILNAGDERKVFASWFPDSRRVLFLAETETHRKLGVWELASGSVRWLVDDPDRNLESAYVPFGSARAVLLEVREARVRASLVDVETGDETALPELPGNLQPLAPTPDGAWVGLYASSTQPADLVRFHVTDPRPGTFTSLTRVWERTPLRPADLAPAQAFRWSSMDGMPMHGWLYRAYGSARGTVVHIHGGPTAHSSDRLNNQIAFLARRGFNVLDPNYRGSTGYSLPFRQEITKTGWGGLEQDDLRTGIEALIAAGTAEAGRVGVTGTSYGGYSSWCLITRCPPETVAAAAPICGMTDLVADYEITRPDIRPYTEEMMGGKPDELPERYRERSPVHFVENIRGKLLIVQGEQDPNVPLEHVRVVLPKLDAAGVPYELLLFPDEGHGIQKPKNQKLLYLRLAEFFERAFRPQS